MDDKLTAFGVTLQNGGGATVDTSFLDGNNDYFHKTYSFTTAKESFEFLKSLIEEEMKKHG